MRHKQWKERIVSSANAKVTGAYVGLALLIFLPLLKLGYVQTFDMAWGPRVPQAAMADNAWLLYHLLQVLSFVLSSIVVQKLLLLGLFVLAGIGAHRLFAKSDLRKTMPQAAYVAGTLYMCNPFVYTRLMAGQWLVLCGYALLPWAVGSLWRLMCQPGRRTALLAFGWTAAVGLTSIHTVGFVLLAALVFFIAQGRQDIARRAKWCAAVASGWVAVNALWLLPDITGKSHAVLAISGFGPGQMHAFASTGTVLGSVPLSTVLLQGFWADPQGRYYLPSHLGWWWGIVAALLGALIVFGFAISVRRRDRLGISLGVLGVIAWWLGMGVGSSWSAGTATFLAHHLPLFRGYREPQKWLMLLALAYAYFAATGTAGLLAYIKAHKPSLEPNVLYTAILLPVLLTPTLLWGAGGQLVSAPYPPGWAQVEQTLDADNGDYKVLVLPWHMYLPLSFAHRVVGNPASHYFVQNVITSDNPELAGVPPQQSSALYRQIDNVLLPQRNVRTDAGAQLAPYHVKYVLLMHEADWHDYGWVARQRDLKLVQQTDSIDLYRVAKSAK